MSRSWVRDGYPSLLPFLRVEGAGRLIDFLATVFKAEEVDRTTAPDGSLIYAALKIDDAVIEVSEARDQWAPLQAALHLYVEDTDATYQQAMAAGAKSLYEPADMPYGERSAGVEDLTGNQWYLATADQATHE